MSALGKWGLELEMLVTNSDTNLISTLWLAQETQGISMKGLSENKADKVKLLIW